MNGTLKTTTLLATVILLTAMTLSACGTPDGNVDEGARWYSMHNCFACHGPNGNDGRAAKIAQLDMSFGSFVRILRDPYSPSMPRYSETKLSKEDAADIYVWLKGIPQ